MRENKTKSLFIDFSGGEGGEEGGKVLVPVVETTG